MAQGNQRDTATYYHIMEQIRWKTERDLSTTMPSADCTLVHHTVRTRRCHPGTCQLHGQPAVEAITMCKYVVDKWERKRCERA